MSCFRPLTIANHKLVKDKVTDSCTITVPCGHCQACKDTRRLGWFVRLYYEWRYCVDNGGFALFETNTYNNEHLPRICGNFDFGDLLPNQHHFFKHLKGIPCFSRRDIQLYIKRVRKRLKTLYPYLDISGHVKYFVAMEIGDLFNRPHYHILWFVSSPFIRPFDFKHIVESLWHEKGFTKTGKLNNGFVCDLGGINYVTKYCCKDLYEEEYWIKILNRLYDSGYKKEDLTDCLPRNLQSKNLGIYALECDMNNDFKNFLDGEIILPDKDNELRKYKLPLYYDRKLFYDTKYRFFDDVSQDYILVDNLSDLPLGVDYTPIYVLNDLGLEMKDNRLQKSIDSVSNVYRIVQSIPELPFLIDKVNEKFDEKFASIKDFQRHIKCNLSEKDFVSYSLVFRGFVAKSDIIIPSCPNYDLRYNFNIGNRISLNHRLLSVEYVNYNYVADKVTNIPYIEDNYQMIRFVFFLIHLELEEIFNERERNYIMQKSAYLAQTELIV